ncbi:hypothetical protein FRC10_005584 [Ceratobasidium sp. 414]|nr:hypothetical protein FRC10_005584 [Ceratobasidium sp. 414]
MSTRATSNEKDDPQQDIKPPIITWVNFHDGAESDKTFNIPVGNVHLRVDNRIFSIPKYRLAEFRKIESKLSVQFHDQLVLEGSYMDFHNAFKILLAPVFSTSPSDFDIQVLISALRIATKFDHPQLRAFCIHNLELRKLPEMDYLPLAREFGIPDWEKKAIDYLSTRSEPIAVEEAELLGTELFVSTAARRERRVARELYLFKVSTRASNSRPDIPSKRPRTTLEEEPVTIIAGGAPTYAKPVVRRRNQSMGPVKKTVLEDSSMSPLFDCTP